MMKRFSRALCAVALVTLSVAPAAPVAAAPPTAEAFSTLPTVDSPVLSPDGSKLAAMVAKDGEMRLMILPIGGGGSPAIISPGEMDVLNWQWVNNDWLVIHAGALQEVGRYGEFYVTRAIAISADGQKINPLLTKLNGVGLSGGDVIWTAKDGSPRVLISLQRSMFLDDRGFYPEVQEVDVSTGEHKVVVQSQNGIFNWYADADGVVRYGTGRMGVATGKPRVIYRASARDQFVDVKTSDDKPAPVPLLFLPGNKAIAVTDDANGFSALYEMDLATMTLGKELHGGKGYDIGGIRRTSDGRSIAGVLRGEAKASIEWLDPVMAQLQRDAAAKFMGADVSVLSTSRDLSRAILLADSPDAPGGYYLFDRATKAVRRIAQVNSALGLAKLNPVRAVRYKARDGLEIEAVLTTPKGKTGPAPIIVMPHGGPAARDYVSWDWWSQFLASKGYIVIQPNYRGSIGYGTAFAEKGEGEWGKKMQDDLDDAVTFLAKEGLGDAKRACIVGGSYGGYAAMRAAERGGVYRCAVSYAGVSDLARMAKENSGELFGKAKTRWLRTQAPDFKSVSPLNNPGAFSMPILIVHGVKDMRVPVSQSREMAKRLKAAGKSHIYIEQPLADHHFSRSEDRLEFLKALEAFLAQHNPA